MEINYKMRIMIIAVTSLHFAALVTFAQTSTSLRETTQVSWISQMPGHGYGNSIWDKAPFTIDDSGNTYLAGNVEIGISNLYDFFVAKLNLLGDTAWTLAYHPSGYSHVNVIRAIILDQENNIYVTGESEQSDLVPDYFTMKISNHGNVLWTARYDGPSDWRDYAKAIGVDSVGNVYVTGKSYSDTTDYDCATVKYSSSGLLQWVRRYTNPRSSPEGVSSMVVDPNGNTFIVGSGVDPIISSDGTYDMMLVSYTANGDTNLLRYYGELHQNEHGQGITKDTDGNIYVTGGFHYGSFLTSHFMETVKYTRFGYEAWVRSFSFGKDGFEEPEFGGKSITIDRLGNVYVGGDLSANNQNWTRDIFVVKYNAQGDTIWTARYGNVEYDDICGGLCLDKYDNVYITGTSNNGAYDQWITIKFDRSGQLKWVARYDTAFHGNSYGSSIELDDSGNVYVAGYAGRAVVMKYIQNPPGFKLDRRFYVFDTTLVSCAKSYTLTVRDTGYGDVLIYQAFCDNPNFVISPSSATIPQFDSTTFMVTFTPKSVGTSTADIILVHNGSTSPDTVQVIATATSQPGDTVVSISYGIGWELISRPVIRDNLSCVPTRVFSYQGSYVLQDTMEYGRGYWKKFFFPSLKIFMGLPIDSMKINVSLRWNIIGSISWPIAVDNITSDPPGMVTSNFYEYDGSNYYKADTIFPGRAYWVKVSGSGQLILDTNTASLTYPVNKIKLVADNDLPPPPPGADGRLVTANLPTMYMLYANYPNPFNPSTIIRYDLPQGSVVRLTVFNTLGQEVARLEEGFQPAGVHRATWNAEGRASGVYFYRLSAGRFTETKKLLLIR